MSDSIGNRAYSGAHYLTANQSVTASLSALDTAAYNNLHGVAGQTLTVGDESAKVRVGQPDGTTRFNGLEIDNSSQAIHLTANGGTTKTSLDITSTGEVSLGTTGTDFDGIKISNYGRDVAIGSTASGGKKVAFSGGAVTADTGVTTPKLTLNGTDATAIDDGSAIDLTSAAPAAGTLATTRGVYNTVKGISDSLGD